MNLIETIQRNLGYGSIEKVDPNSQEVKDKNSKHGTASLAQAAIPAILLGIFNRLERDPNPDWLVGDQPAGHMLDRIFGSLEEPVIEKVSAYSPTSGKNAKAEMEHIASESVRLIRDQIADLNNESRIASYTAHSKRDILPYLPASLQLGTLLGNNNLDDRTNKMEGPVSSLMHRLENQFNSSENN